MNKAFIFDLDGVLIDDESIWEDAKKEIYLKLFGRDIYTRMGSTIGINIDGIYEKAVECGSTLPKEKLIEAFYERATSIYQTAPVLPELEHFVTILKKFGFVIGIVSASPKQWIDIVVERLPLKKHLSTILSLFDRPDLPYKPAPDGYIEAMKILHSTPESTIALEDSTAGIASAKAAGAYTIGFKLFLVKGYEQKGADIYAENLQDVIRIVKNYSS